MGKKTKQLNFYIYLTRRNRLKNSSYGELVVYGIIFEQQAKENIITWMNELTKDCAGIISRHKAFFDGLINIKQVITYGHSMAEVDWPYFEEIIKRVGINIPWTVSCHTPDDVENANAFRAHFGITTLKILNKE